MIASGMGGWGASETPSDDHVRALFGMNVDPAATLEGSYEDPFWQTPQGVALMATITEAAERDKAAKAAADRQLAAARDATQARNRAASDAAAAAWRSKQEEAARAESERVQAAEAERAARWETIVAERAAIAAAKEEAHTQDCDFQAFRFSIAVRAAWEDDSLAFDSERDPSYWDVIPSDAKEFGDRSPANASKNERFSQTIVAQISEALAPFLQHFASTGCIRADGLEERLIGGAADQGGDPTFYLVCGAEDAALDPAALGIFDASVMLEALPGVSATVTGYSAPINATRLFEALHDCTAPTGSWGGDRTPDLMPQAGESRDAWAGRVAAPSSSLARLIERWDVAGHDVELYASYGAPASLDDSARRFVGIWPCEAISLVVGAGGSGKSTTMHEWVAAVGGADLGHGRRVWGCDITGRFVAALIFGEESKADVAKRGTAFVPLWGDPGYFAKDAHGMQLEEVVAWLDRAPVLDFVVIDPARMFVEGNEDSSDVVSSFFSTLLAFARRKGCAVVVVHHMTKGGNRLLQHMLAAVRGSGVFSDRPRLLVGVTEKSRAVHVGWIKGNMLKDDPVLAVLGAVNEGRLFRRDPDTYTLIPLDAPAPEAAAAIKDDTADRVLAALALLLASGESVFQTGWKSLYARKVGTLAGISRPKIEAAVHAHIAAGRIVDGGTGLRDAR